MYNDPISKKVIDILGNLSLNPYQKSFAILAYIQDAVKPEDYSKYIKVSLECYGLCPRHETKVDIPEIDQALITRIESSSRTKVDHELRGWFEINTDKAADSILNQICYYLENWTEIKEKAIIFQMILSSKYVPIKVNFFSRYMDEENDTLILREHANEYIQMRQILNLNIGPTARGSLIMDFIQSLQEKPQAQAVVLGSFIEELLRRLKQKKTSPNPTPNLPPFPTDVNQMKDMVQKMQHILPPEVFEQLKRLFSDGSKD